MSARTKARKRAVDVLFEADQRRIPFAGLLEDRLQLTAAQTPLPEYSQQIVHGVSDHSEQIDEWLASYSRGWTLNRMPAVDRAILRAGAWEIAYNDEVPEQVSIKEAADLAADLSTNESPGFISGLLGRIAELKDTLI